MKRILTATILVAAISLLFSQPASVGASQRSNNDQAVRKLLDELYAALGSADTAALDRIYADSYGLVNDDGTVTTKAPRLAAIKSGELKYESVSYDELNVRFYGDTAVAVCRVTSRGQLRGQGIGGQFRVTLTLLKMKGRWQVAAAQVTRIAGQ